MWRYWYDSTEEEIEAILVNVEFDPGLVEMWNRFRNAYYFVGELDWEEIVRFDIECIREIIK